jgi:hypothetical protein
MTDTPKIVVDETTAVPAVEVPTETTVGPVAPAAPATEPAAK